MLTGKRIDHVVRTCRDVAATIRFCTEVLDMREVTFGAAREVTGGTSNVDAGPRP